LKKPACLRQGMRDEQLILLAHLLFWGVINGLKIMKTFICKIPPNLPLPKGGIIPLFGKEGLGEIF
jgi:hypothetical protein